MSAIVSSFHLLDRFIDKFIQESDPDWFKELIHIVEKEIQRALYWSSNDGLCNAAEALKKYTTPNVQMVGHLLTSSIRMCGTEKTHVSIDKR